MRSRLVKAGRGSRCGEMCYKGPWGRPPNPGVAPDANQGRRRDNRWDTRRHTGIDPRSQ